jgi:hypothetical protein
MHRPLLIAAFGILLASVPLAAQRGGGHGGGGGHFGGGGGHAGMASHGGGFGGHASGVHTFSGARSGSSFAARGPASRQSFSGRSFSGRSSSRQSLSASSSLRSRGFNRPGVRIRTFGFRNNCGGFDCRGAFGNPWWYAGAYNPYWWWDSDSSYDQDQQDQAGLASEMNQQSLEEQRMRQQGDQDVYASSAPPPPPSHQHEEDRKESVQPTVLVFRDQRKQEVQNYAIVGQTLWSFAPQHTQKIPLSDLDLPATTKANDERGITFRVPGTGEGQ